MQNVLIVKIAVLSPHKSDWFLMFGTFICDRLMKGMEENISVWVVWNIFPVLSCTTSKNDVKYCTCCILQHHWGTRKSSYKCNTDIQEGNRGLSSHLDGFRLFYILFSLQGIITNRNNVSIPPHLTTYIQRLWNNGFLKEPSSVEDWIVKNKVTLQIWRKMVKNSLLKAQLQTYSYSNQHNYRTEAYVMANVRGQRSLVAQLRTGILFRPLK